MERRFLKYEFGTQTAFNTLKNNHLVDDEGNFIQGIHVVEVGNIVTTPAILDEAGEVITPAVMTGKWAVDILWEIEPIGAFKAKEKYPKGQVAHTFAGIEGMYKKELYREFPELKPVDEEI